MGLSLKMSALERAGVSSGDTAAHAPGSPLCEWRAELDAPVIAAVVARVCGGDAVVALTTQGRAPIVHAITTKGINGSKSVCSLGRAAPGEPLTAVCALDERVFLASVSAIYELMAGSHRTHRLVLLYPARDISWPIRSLSAERCGAAIVLVATFGLPAQDPQGTGLLLLCLRGGCPQATVLPVSVADTACPSLRYDPASSLLYVLTPTTDAGVVLCCVCFQEPVTSDPALRGFEWFTQTGTEFYMSRVVVSSPEEHLLYRCKEGPGLAEAQVGAVCMCGTSAVVAVSAVFETGERSDLPVLLVVSGLLSHLLFSTIELDGIGSQSLPPESESFRICSLSPSSAAPGSLCLAFCKGSLLHFHRMPVESGADGPRSVGTCELAPSTHMFCALYETEGALRCVFTAVDGARLFLCMASTQVSSGRRAGVGGRSQKDQEGRQRKHKARVSDA